MTLSHVRRKGRQRDDLSPLLNTVAKNLLVERFRSGGRELAMEIHERHLPHGDDISESVARGDRALRIREAIDALPERQRDAVLLWMDGAGPADIAMELDLKRNAADALLHRARRKLAESLADYRDAVWGSSAVLWLRPRARRMLWWLSSAETPVGNLAPALLTISCVGLLAVTVPPPPDGDRLIDDTRTSSLTERAPRASEGSGPIAGGADVVREQNGSSAPGSAPASPVEVDVRDHRIGVRQDIENPATGEKMPFGVGFRHEREESRGLIGEDLDRTTELFCGSAPSACW